MKIKIASALIAASLLAAPAMAAKAPVFVETAVVRDTPAVTADPAKGYIYLRTAAPLPLFLMRVPSEEDQKVYDELRAAALAKEQKKYPGRFATYNSSLKTYEMLKKSGGNPGTKPVMPVEPTEENFEFTPFVMLANASMGPLNRFAKGEGGASVYLQSITPGSYRIYGLMSPLLAGPQAGPCLCMGSVKFTVRAGEVTDLGTIGLGTALLTPVMSSDAVDPRLAGWTIHPADYHAVGKLPNYFGGPVSRINPIPGVIAFDRDRIIDAASDSTTVRPDQPAAEAPAGEAGSPS